MIPTQQDPNYGNSGSGFAAHPRVVNQKQRFKDPYSKNGEYPYLRLSNHTPLIESINPRT
jgi:hypothetical protein